jgi:CRISPR-associated protein Csb1
MEYSMSDKLSLQTLAQAVAGHAAALRCVTEYQPAGGPGDKLFPPTYEGGKYAFEERYIEGERVPCVLIDSVQSQANRMELALLHAWERGQLSLPVIIVDFAGRDLPKPMRVTSLEAPHRIADAILRDSKLDGVPFRKSPVGRVLDLVDGFHATPLFELCPTALVFGMWDSTGPRGGLGAKFARAMVSEIVGLHAVPGKRTASRIDPLQIQLGAGPLYQAADAGGIGWTLDASKAVKSKKEAAKLGKDGRPSEANHGNVTPSIADGGVTISKAVQTTVLSLPALRRLRFPVGNAVDVARDDAARTALAALALCAATLTRAQGCDLRSRCLLQAQTPIVWELLDEPGSKPKLFTVPLADALSLHRDAVARARDAGLPWREEPLALTPSDELVMLLRRSQELESQAGASEAGA